MRASGRLGPVNREEARLFPALLRHWRTRRGMSQLDLALTADVSAKHVSFLETGRAQPSREMVLGLAAALDVPLRDQNVLLESAGFPPAFAEPRVEEGLPAPIERAIGRMMEKHEPFPMIVVNRRRDVLRMNVAAARFFQRAVLDPSALGSPPNLLRALFDPRLARQYIVDWDVVAPQLLLGIHRDALAHPSDPSLAELVSELLSYPDVPKSFRTPDLATPVEPTLEFRFRRDDLVLSFLTTVTVFHGPRNVTLEELGIESFFPLDDTTARACEALAAE